MKQELFREKNIHGTPLFSFTCYTIETQEAEQIKDYHWHKEVEWIYIVEGSIMIDIDMEKILVSSNNLICIPSEALHKMETMGKCLYYAFVFQLEMLSFSKYDYCEQKYILSLINKKKVLKKVIDLSVDNNKLLIEIDTLVEIFIKKEVVWQLGIKACLLKILYYLFFSESIEDAEYEFSSDNDIRIGHIKVILIYMREHYQDKIYIEELAALINLNPTYFCKYFKKLTDKTPIEYLNNIRIEQAAKLLKESDLSIIEICYQVGFEHVSYFIKKFKEQKGITPKKYKKEVI